MTTEETVSVARGGRSTILSRDNAPANSPINAKGQHPPFFAHPGHGLSPFRPRSVSSKFEEVFFRVRSFPPSSRGASIWAPDPSISDEDEVRFIVSNGARDIIPNAAAQCAANTLSTNCRADSLRLKVSARARASSLGIERAASAARPRFASSTPAPLSPITSSGPTTGFAATGRPDASASSSTRPKVSVKLGNTNTSALA